MMINELSTQWAGLPPEEQDYLYRCCLDVVGQHEAAVENRRAAALEVAHQIVLEVDVNSNDAIPEDIVKAARQVTLADTATGDGGEYVLLKDIPAFFEELDRREEKGLCLYCGGDLGGPCAHRSSTPEGEG